MMYNLENYRGFCVVMVIECSLASGQNGIWGVEVYEGSWVGREESGEEWMGVKKGRGGVLS